MVDGNFELCCDHLQSENQLILICLEEFIWLWMHFKRFRVFEIDNVQ